MLDSCLALRWGACLLFISFAFAGICRGQNHIRIESEAEGAARERIEIALGAVTSIDCIDKPLNELLGELSQRMGVPIVLARRELADAAIADDTPVTAHIARVSYRSLLRLVLKDLDLTWTFRDEVIFVTTRENAESLQETRLYPVLDLVSIGSTLDRSQRGVHDYDTLIDTITTTVEPDTWDEVGGPGTIAEYPGAGALVITQTTEIHDQVEKVLSALRRVKQVQGISAAALPSLESKRIKTAQHVEAKPRRYSSAQSQGWQLPRVHGGE